MRLSVVFVISILFLSLMPSLIEANDLVPTQDRPTFRYQKNNQVASGLVIIGNTTDSQFGMLSSRITTIDSMIRITGTPLIEEINSFRINASGTFTKYIDISSRTVGTYFEVDDYLPQYNELERYKISDSQKYVESDDNFETSFDLLRLGYFLFRNNDSYRMVEDQRSGVTAFVLRSGSIRNILLNDTDGRGIGQVFSFQISINIYYFNTANQEFLGVYQTRDFGYGNIMPESVFLYLKSDQFTRELAGGSIGEKLFEDYRFSNIEWINMGFNSTLGLDIYEGVYFISRETTSVLSSSRSNAQKLQLNQETEDLEQFQNDLIDDNLVDAFNDDIISAFEEQISQGVLNVNGITVTSFILVGEDGNNTSTTISNLTNLYNEKFIFIAQLSGMLIVTFVLIRRKKNS